MTDQPHLAFSNIAWEPAQDAEIAAVLREAGFAGVELAPTKRWPDPTKAAAAEVRDYRAHWAAHGLRVVAFQALLFGREDLQLFDPRTRQRLADYLTRIIDLGVELGARAFVFG